VQGVLFDLDGTLIDSYAAIADSLNHALEAAGRATLPADEVRPMVGHGLESLVSRVLDGQGVEEGVLRFRERYAQIYKHRTQVLPGVAETVRTLARRGYRMGVASNKPARFGRPLLEHLGLAPHLQGVLGPDLVAHPKPHPAMVRRLLEVLQLEPAQVVYVGDMPVDVETCRNAEIPCWLVPTGSSTLEELERAGGNRVLLHFSDLLDLLP
jgi:phosphoglycolate phosphatase